MNKKITYTGIEKFLIRCKWNPKNPGTLKIISDVGNPDYYENRAKEFISEASKIKDKEEYDKNIINAVRLLVLARETRNG
jgi:beta-N-acetylglucosaminidase